jgi:protein-tyrosine phosphatase
MSSDVFRIVVLCTGNRFRSPLAERVLRREAGGLPVEVESFGLLQLDRIGVLPELVDYAVRSGIEVSDHRSRPLVRGSLAAVDLVLGFERIHLAEAVITGGAALERTFTLPELAALVGTASPRASGGEFVSHARATINDASERRAADPRHSVVPEIADPIGQPASVAAEIAERVHRLSIELAGALFRSRRTH